MNYGELNYDELKTLAENGDVEAMVTLADTIREHFTAQNMMQVFNLFLGMKRLGIKEMLTQFSWQWIYTIL